MHKETVINSVQKMLEGVLPPQSEHFLVDIRIKPTNNIKVFLDGDKGVGIDDLVKYNRAVYKQLEEDGLFPDGDFSLEISSAGIDEPLKMHRQYLKNIGRNVQVTFLDGSVKEGKMVSVTETQIEIEETKGNTRPGGSSGRSKKIEILKHTVPFEDIKTTKIVIKF